MQLLQVQLFCRIVTMNTFRRKGIKVITHGLEQPIGKETMQMRGMIPNPRKKEKHPRKNQLKVRSETLVTKPSLFSTLLLLRTCLICCVQRRNVEVSIHHLLPCYYPKPWLQSIPMKRMSYHTMSAFRMTTIIRIVCVR